MVFLHIILGNFAVVGLSGFLKEVRSVLFLQECILICDLIAREWQKSYEITQIKVYCRNKRKSPFATIVSMIAKGDVLRGHLGVLLA